MSEFGRNNTIENVLNEKFLVYFGQIHISIFFFFFRNIIFFG